MISPEHLELFWLFSPSLAEAIIPDKSIFSYTVYSDPKQPYKVVDTWLDARLRPQDHYRDLNLRATYKVYEWSDKQALTREAAGRLCYVYHMPKGVQGISCPDYFACKLTTTYGGENG